MPSPRRPSSWSGRPHVPGPGDRSGNVAQSGEERSDLPGGALHRIWLADILAPSRQFRRQLPPCSSPIGSTAARCSLQACKCAGLVLAHQSAVASNVNGDDGRDLASDLRPPPCLPQGVSRRTEFITCEWLVVFRCGPMSAMGQERSYGETARKVRPRRRSRRNQGQSGRCRSKVGFRG